MTAFFPARIRFNKGELSPLLLSRADIDHWQSGLELCTNWILLREGGLRKRSGTIFVSEVKDSSKKVRLMPHVFSASQAYVLEMGENYTRFYANRGVLGGPYEIATTYAEANLFSLEYVQSADVMYIADGNTPPRQLRRKADTDWEIKDIEFEDGPFTSRKVTSASIDPNGTGRDLPNTAATDMGTSAGSLSNMSNNDISTFWRSSQTVGYVRWDFGAGQATLNAISITCDDEFPGNAPSQFQVQGSDTTTENDFVTLFSVTEERDWLANETRHFEWENETAYRYYRLSIQAPSGGTNKRIQMNEVRWKTSANAMSNITFDFSDIADVNEGNGFGANDIGRQVRFQGNDNLWRYTKILAVNSTSQFEGKIYGPALPDARGTIFWRLGAFSIESGFPVSVCFYQERLVWGGTKSQPITVFGSKNGDFEDHGVSDPLLDDDAINITALASEVNQIRWLEEGDDIIIGSAGSIRTIGPSDITRVFSATNLEQRRRTTYGSGDVKPIRAGNATIFVGRAGITLREFLRDGANYLAPDISVLSRHLLYSKIVDMAWQQDPTPQMWLAMSNGELISVTYDREQNIIGFARHQIAGGAVESVAVIPNQAGYDDLYMVVRRTIQGGTKRYVEILEREYESSETAREDGIFLDSCLTYSGAPATVITGLDHLEGENVTALADGIPEAGLTVSGGQVTLSTSASKVHVGLPYAADAVTLPMVEEGRMGGLWGQPVTNIAVFMDLFDTGDILAGSAFSVERPTAHEGGELKLLAVQDLATGVYRCDFDQSWQEEEGRGRVYLKSNQPLPATVRALCFQREAKP